MQHADILPTVQFLWQNRENLLPIDWLIEYYWTINDFPARLQWYRAEMTRHNKKLYTYRYQLMEHIGISSSIGSRGYTMPGCYELQTASGLAQYFDLNTCGHTLFHPCQAAVATFTHDAVLPNEAGFFIRPASPTPDMYLSTLQNIELRICAHDCKCCDCVEGAFELINNCFELKRMLNLPQASCDHAQEEGAPYLDEDRVVYVAVRKSRMTCYDNTAMPKRVCPCRKQ